jgi:hypothetical protein
VNQRIVAKDVAKPLFAKASSKTKLSNWIEGDLLMLSKRSFWLELVTDVSQPSGSVERILKALPALAAGLGAISVWQWNATLMLALLMGAGGSCAVFQVLRLKKKPWQAVRQWLHHPQAALTLSVGCGVVLMTTTYAALAVGQDFKSPSFAVLMLIQDFGIFVVLGLVILLVTQKVSAPLYSFDRCVAGLLHRDELQRLVAVRQLAVLAAQQQLKPREQAIAAEYLLLLSRKPNDPAISSAIQESLAVLVPTRPQLGERTVSNQPLHSPMQGLSVEVGYDRRDVLEPDLEPAALRSA